MSKFHMGIIEEQRTKIKELERIIETRGMMLKGRDVENRELAEELANSNRLLENAKRVFREHEKAIVAKDATIHEQYVAIDRLERQLENASLADSSIARFKRIRERHRAGVQRELRLGGALEKAEEEIEDLKQANYHEHELAERRLREILLTAAQREDLKAKVQSLEVQLNDAYAKNRDLGKQIHHAKAALEGRTEVVDVPTE